MRVTVGAVAVLGLAVTVATAQPGKERAAALKAPEPLAAGELPQARGATSDDAPLSSTPVPRARGSTPGGPAWLTGVDPNVLPAAGTTTKAVPVSVRPLSAPPTLGKDDPVPPPPKLLDRLRPFPGDKPPAGVPQSQPQPQQPQAQPQPPAQPTAASPFRGTGTNGTPVYAGPPAYRWYGWGSVTPGSNPLAPAGQYPKASANWYAITGATPGAFPVPVSNPGRITPGTEPPTYGLAASRPAPPPVVPLGPVPQPAPVFIERVVERPETPKFNSQPDSKFLPGPPPSASVIPPPAFGPPSMPVSVPTLTSPPNTTNPKPASVTAAPSMPLPPTPLTPPAVAGPVTPPKVPAVAPVVPKAEPVVAKPVPITPPVPALPPAVPTVAPVPSVLPAAAEPTSATEPKPSGPAPGTLPMSVTAEPAREEPKWQQSSEPAGSRPGTWAPANNAVPLPTVPVEKAPDWQTGHAKTAPVIRAQQPDNNPDPITTLVKQVCHGRAEGVEVRWTGTKKFQVCFEIRTAEAAKLLVADISKRPELTAYQIDFCVVVK